MRAIAVVAMMLLLSRPAYSAEEDIGLRIFDKGKTEKIAAEEATSGIGVWMQANLQSCPAFCTSKGLTNLGDPAGGNSKCASGEAIPPGAAGLSFPYGCWPNCTPHNYSNTASDGQWCWASGQLKDYDSSDKTVGCFCSNPPQSPLRIRKGTKNYAVILVDPSNPNATGWRVKTPTGIQAVKKIPDGMWYQANGKNCPIFCPTIGKVNASDPAGGNAKCTSGENVPAPAVGVISYVYGCWPNCSAHLSGTTPSSENEWCWGAGQTKDYDSSDKTVGCFCK